MIYKVRTLDELVKIKYGKNQRKVESPHGTIPIYGTGGLIGYATEALYTKPSVLIGRKGTIDKVKFIKDPFWTVDTLFYTEINESLVLPKYLYYVLCLVDLGRYNEGTTIPSLRTETLNRLSLRIPSLEIQKKVLSVLNPIDDKIEYNTEINKNLERQSQVIFKSWFVDFEPFGRIMPKSFTLTKLGKIATIQTSNMSPSKNKNVTVEHYSIPAYDESRFPIFEASSNIKSNKYLLSNKSVMISKLNPETKRIWRPMCLSEHPICSTEFIVYEAINKGYRDFLYSLVDSEPFFNYLCSHTTGSTNSRQRTSPRITLDFEFYLPPNDWIQKFCSMTAPLYDTISSNLIEIQTLTSLRDALLPRLMLGELDVSNIEL